MKRTFRKSISLILVVITLLSTLSVFAVSASAASYPTNYSSYNMPESNDFARWSGTKVVKGSSTSKDEIKWMQAALNYCIANEGLKASYLTVDGSFGPASKKATVSFQKAVGLTQDGSFGPSTIKKMKEILNDGKASFVNDASSTYNLVWPVSTSVKAAGTITSAFGPRNTGIKDASTNHRGVDIGVKVGTDIYSATDGEVTAVGYNKYRGYYVVVYHSELNISTLYQHLNSYDVKKGDKVFAGEKIADSGKTGIGSGAHLHFGVMVGKATKADHDQPGYNMAINPCGENITYRNYK